MPRGGARQGIPGKAYGSRTDLNQNRSMLNATPPSQTYGQNAAQNASTSVVPVAPAPNNPVDAATQHFAQNPLPNLNFSGPSERPMEALTTGLPSGPGVGPAPAAQTPNAQQYVTTRDTIQTLAASQPQNSALAFLARSADGAY